MDLLVFDMKAPVKVFFCRGFSLLRFSARLQVADTLVLYSIYSFSALFYSTSFGRGASLFLLSDTTKAPLV